MTVATRFTSSAADAADIRSNLLGARAFGAFVPALEPLAGLALQLLDGATKRGPLAESHARALATLADAINLLVNDPRLAVPQTHARVFELIVEDAAQTADAASRLLRAVERRRRYCHT